MGRVWRLETGLGATVAVKELLWGGDERSVRYEVAFRDAAAAEGRVEAPASYRTVDGDYLCDLGSALVRVYDWAVGTPVTTPDADTAGWVGRTLAGLHNLARAGGNGAPDPWYWRCPDEAQWQELLMAAGEVAWFDDLQAALPRLLDLATRVSPGPGPSWICCHRDIQPSNVLCHAGHHTLLDWENAGPASPARELASNLLAWLVDKETTVAFLAAYRDAGGPVETLDPGAFSMGIAPHMNYVYVQARAARDPGLRPEDRRFADGECARMLAGLPTPALLDELLETARSVFGRARPWYGATS